MTGASASARREERPDDLLVNPTVEVERVGFVVTEGLNSGKALNTVVVLHQKTSISKINSSETNRGK